MMAKNNSRINPLFALMLILGLGMAHPAAAQKYAITDLGTLGGSKSFAYDINARGQIVGESETSENGGEVGIPPTHAFFWADDKITDLGTLPGGRNSYAYSINQAGLAVGFSLTGSNSNGGAFLWGEEIGMTNLGTLAGGNLSGAYGINTASQVTGFSEFSGTQGLFDHAFLWSGGEMSDIGTLGYSYSYGKSINDSGQVVGYSGTADGAAHAFLWENGKINDLGTLPGGSDSYANRINNMGEVVGQSITASGEYHAFFLGKNGMVDLGTLGGGESEALGINDLSQVVGSSTTIMNGSLRSHAFLCQDGQGMQDLNNFIPADSGWELVAALAINKGGQIVGWGYVDGTEVERAFLLTPVEPQVLGVKIKIKPWRDCNRIDPKEKWELVPVAILSSPGFNAPGMVERHSLTFGRTGDEESLAFCRQWSKDVNRDGLKDLICYFHVGPMGFHCGDKEGVLKGKTVDGKKFEGVDEVQIYPCCCESRRYCKR
jgi:probable HAF family extracellular repeat protein